MEQTISTPVATAYTVGVEEEYQLVDPATGALRDRATTLREADWKVTAVVCDDVLVKYKHEANGHLDYVGSGVNRNACQHPRSE